MKTTIELNKLIQCIALFFLSIYIFFPSLSIRDLCSFIAVVSLIICVILKKHPQLGISLTTKIWGGILIYSVVVSCISVGVGGWSNEGISTVKWLFLAVLLYQLLLLVKVNPKIVIKILFIFSTVFLLMTYLQFANVEIVDIINSYLLNAEDLQTNFQAKLWGSYYGITSSNFLNAFYISIFSAIFSAKILNYKKGYLINYIMYIVGILTIFLTGKKGLIIANILALCICIIVTEKIKILLLIKRFILVLFVGGGILFIINLKTSIISNIMLLTIESDDVSNGRFAMYSIAWNNIEKNFILGQGWGSSYILFSQGVHNIYIQLLYEIGIIGVFLFILFFIFNLGCNIRDVKKCINKDERVVLVFCLYIQIVFLIYGMSGNPLFYYSTLLIYFIVLAMQSIKKKGVKF